jgi:hypothetical protein
MPAGGTLRTPTVARDAAQRPQAAPWQGVSGASRRAGLSSRRGIMMKRLICAVLVVVMLSMVPMMMAGCEPKREVTIERKLEVKTEPEKKAPPPGPKIIVE